MKTYYRHGKHTEEIRTTFCGLYDDDSQKLTIGASRCSVKDNFARAIGRDRSRERAETSPVCIALNVNQDKALKVFLTLTDDLKNKVVKLPASTLGNSIEEYSSENAYCVLRAL